MQYYLDDIIVTEKTEEEHMKILKAVLQRIKEYGLRLRKEDGSGIGAVFFHALRSGEEHPIAISSVFLGTYFPVSYLSQATCNYN